MTMTKLENMINPQVLASMIDGELEYAIKFAPLATVDTTLVGRQEIQYLCLRSR